MFCLEATAKEKRQCAGVKGGVVATYTIWRYGDVILELMFKHMCPLCEATKGHGNDRHLSICKVLWLQLLWNYLTDFFLYLVWVLLWSAELHTKLPFWFCIFCFMGLRQFAALFNNWRPCGQQSNKLLPFNSLIVSQNSVFIYYSVHHNSGHYSVLHNSGLSLY